MKKFLISLLIVLGLVASSNATTYYVSTTGSNANNGTSPSTPWAHPNYTNGRISSGDIVQIADGVYDTCYILPPRGGTAKTYYLGNASNRNNVVLCSGYTLTGGWTVFSGNIYVYTPTIPERWNHWVIDGHDLECVTEDNIVLESRSSTGNMTAGTSYYNYTTDKLYVWTRDGSTPADNAIKFSQTCVIRFDHGDQDSINFKDLTIDMGVQAVIILGSSEGSGTGAPDAPVIENCNVKNGSCSFTAQNQALVYCGNPTITDKTTLGQGFVAVNDTFMYCYAPGGSAEHNGAGVDLYGYEFSTITNNVFMNLGGTALNFKNGFAGSITVEQNVITNNVFRNINTAFRVGAHTDSLIFAGNYIMDCTYRGIDIHCSVGTPTPPYHRVKILNNTLWNAAGTGADGESITISPTAGSTGSGNEIKWNIIFDTATVERCIGFVYQTEAPIQSPPTESYWIIDYNMYYTGSGSFACRFISGSGCTGTNWTSWRGCTYGYDSHSTNTTNPNFTASHIPTLSRPSSPQEMNQTYAGQTWTRYGAWQPTTSCPLPGVPTLNYPANNTAEIALPVVFDWSDIADVDLYRLQVDDNFNFSSPVIDVQVATSTYNATTLSPAIKYYWRVSAHNSCGWGTFSSDYNFISACQGILPSAPSLISPSNGQADVSTTVTVSWSAVPTASSYQLQIDDNSDFSSLFVNQGTSATSYDVVGLTNLTTYYLRLQTTNYCGTGSWSQTYSFVTTGSGPAADSIVSVVDASNQDYYVYYYNVSPSFSLVQPRLYGGNIGPELMGFGTLHDASINQGTEFDGVYIDFVQDVSNNGGNVRIYGEKTATPAVFTTWTDIGTRTLTTTYVDWTMPATLTAGEIYRTPDLSAIVNELTQLYSLNGIAFHIRDNGSSGGNCGIFASWDNETYNPPRLVLYPLASNTAPTVPVLVSPIDGITINTTKPTLTINNSTDTEGGLVTYEFQIASDADFTNVIVQSGQVAQGSSTTSWLSTTEFANNTYYWRARSYDGELYSSYSSGEDFIVYIYQRPNEVKKVGRR